MDPFFHKWHTKKHKAKHRWALLTDTDIEEIETQEHLINILQKRYGFERNQAIAEMTAWVEEED